jgi:uncharacterized membrane protein
MFGLVVSRPEQGSQAVPGRVRPLQAMAGVAGFSVVGLALGRAGLEPPPAVPAAASLALLAAGCWACWAALAERGGRAWAGLLIAGGLGGGAELAGTLTGWPFGRYAYTGAWRPSLSLPGGEVFSLPVVLAWAMVAGAAYCLVPPGWPAWGRVLATAVACTVADLAMEPVLAGPAGYWRWVGAGPMPGGAPVQNSVGWFLVSAACAGVLVWMCPKGGSPKSGAGVLGLFAAVLAALWALG